MEELPLTLVMVQVVAVLVATNVEVEEDMAEMAVGVFIVPILKVQVAAHIVLHPIRTLLVQEEEVVGVLEWVILQALAAV